MADSLKYAEFSNISLLSNTSHLPDNPPSRLSANIAVIIMSVFLLAAILAILWILFSVLRSKDMRGVIVNIFIISLCVNDLLNCFNQFFIILSYISLSWTMGLRLCYIVPEFSMFIAGSSLWHHSFIAIHRYIVVCHNDIYVRWSKQTYTLVVLILTRLLPLGFVIPAFIIDMSVYVPKLLRCVFSATYGLRTLVIIIVLIFIPFIVVMCCFSVIFCFIHRQGRGSLSNSRTLQHEIQITKMFAVIFFVFLLGYVPYGFIRIFDKSGALSPETYVIVTVLFAVSGSLNPLIYGAMNKSIRDACLSSCPCRIECNLKQVDHSKSKPCVRQGNGNMSLSEKKKANEPNQNDENRIDESEPKTSDALLSSENNC